MVKDKTITSRRFPISKIIYDKEESFDKKSVKKVLKDGKTKGTGIQLGDIETFKYLEDKPVSEWETIIISNENELMDGFHRLVIAQMRNLKTIPTTKLSKKATIKYYDY